MNKCHKTERKIKDANEEEGREKEKEGTKGHWPRVGRGGQAKSAQQAAGRSGWGAAGVWRKGSCIGRQPTGPKSPQLHSDLALLLKEKRAGVSGI